jgi:hypothetical protein
MKHRLLAVAALLGAVFTAGPAFGYTTFLLPQDFWPSVDNVAIQGASTQTFYNAGVAVPGDLQVVKPDGTAGVINHAEVGADMTTVNIALSDVGTYRISTGEVLGPLTPVWDLGNDARGDPRIQAKREGEPAPAGATAGAFQSVQMAASYLTYGQPSRTVVDQSAGHLVIHPITDPNQIVQSSGFQIEVLFNGAPLPNFSVVVYGNGDADTNLAHYVNTDAAGRASLTFAAPGHYTATVRKLARAAPGGEATIQLFTTTLTFEVMTAEHASVAVQTAPPPRAQQPRRPQSPRRDRRDRTLPL